MTSSPFQTVQSIGAAGESSPLFPDGRNRIIQGDCLAVMRALPDAVFDVIYLDPPFCTGKDFHLHNSAPRSVRSFTDIWENGLPEYLQWLEERLVEMIRLLQPEGALFVHLDWHAVHYVKVMLDRMLGYRHFQNEFVWYYSGGGASKQRFARKHDTILYYTKSAQAWKFYPDRVRVPHKWTKGQKRADGSSRDYTRGKLADDVWQHHALMPWAGENQGYPTQKPMELLQRLLLATSDEGDVIGDFFCGSGTTAAVAQQLGRRWVTADVSRVAICLAAERLAETVCPGAVTYQAARSRARAQERFAAILADEARLGLDDPTGAYCAEHVGHSTGFVIETCAAIPERSAPATPVSASAK